MKRSKADLPYPGELRGLIDPEGRLAIRVTPGGRVEAITLEGNKVSVKVRAKPQDGAANEAVIRLVALALEIAPSKVKLLRGATSREKRLRILL